MKLVKMPNCPVCGQLGRMAYEELSDRIFGAQGRWSMKACADDGCGAYWLDPRPATDELVRLYANYYTHGEGGARRSFYERLLRAFQKTHFRLAPSMLDRLIYWLLMLHPGRRFAALAACMGIRPVQGGRLLEVGCGDGAKLAALNELGWISEGIDFDPGAVGSARSKGLDVKVGGLEEQHYSAGIFDAVVSTHVVEHVADVRSMFAEALRVLKPGGYFVAYTPNAASMGHRIFGRHWRGLEIPRHLQIFTPAALARLARETGYAVERCGSSGRGGTILVKSYRLWCDKSGAGDVERLGKWNRFAAELLGFAVGMLAAFRHPAGDEIVLIARKPFAQGGAHGTEAE
jgi:2-polyprenyl-3-methyl-5-hydroxy-6-metoxy-1,4-benzoquinol methylase